MFSGYAVLFPSILTQDVLEGVIGDKGSYFFLFYLPKVEISTNNLFLSFISLAGLSNPSYLNGLCCFSLAGLLSFTAVISEKPPIFISGPKFENPSKFTFNAPEFFRVENLELLPDLGVVDCLGEVTGEPGTEFFMTCK